MPRSPFNTLTFHFPDGPVRLSDRHMQIGADIYEPIVESFGTLEDNVDSGVLSGGRSLEARQLTISIVSSGSQQFYEKFRDVGIEQIKVDLYQGFGDTSEHFLIDTFICQAPIRFSEKSQILDIDLVSVIMGSNPYISGMGNDTVRYPTVLGSMAGLKLTATQEDVFTHLAEALTVDYVGDVSILSSKSLVGSSRVLIDTEFIDVSIPDDVTMTIISRGAGGTVASSHAEGQIVNKDIQYFDYWVSEGPVESISNLVLGDVAYPNAYVPLPNAHPTLLRFHTRPPYWSTSSESLPPIVPDPETTVLFGIGHSYNVGEGADPPTGIENINNESQYVGMYIHADWTLGEIHTVTYTPEGAFEGQDYLKLGFRHPNVDKWQFYTKEPDTTSGDSNVQRSFLRDLSHLGNFISAKIRLELTPVQLYKGTWDFRFGYFKPGDTWVYPYEESADVSGATTQFPWYGLQFLSGVLEGIDTWEDLRTLIIISHIQVFQTNHGEIAGTGVHADVMFPNVDVTYQDAYGSNKPVQNVFSAFGQDISYLGTFLSLQCEVTFSVSTFSTPITEIQQYISYREGTGGTQQALWSELRTTPIDERTITVDVPQVTSWQGLITANIGLQHQIVGTDEPTLKMSNIQLKHVKWLVTYQPPDIIEPDISTVHFIDTDDLSCTVTSSEGSLVTPPELVYNSLSRYGFSNHIDATRYETVIQEYKDAQWYLNGVVNIDFRLHDLLREVMHSGMGRLRYTEGFIDFIGVFGQDPLAHTYTPDEIKLRSFVEERDGLDTIANIIKIAYSGNVEGETTSVIEVQDIDSMARYGIQNLIVEHPLIQEQQSAIASFIVNRLLEVLAFPLPKVSFKVFLNDHVAIKKQKISFNTDFNGYGTGTGELLTQTRTFGQGKTGQINEIEIVLVGVTKDEVD